MRNVMKAALFAASIFSSSAFAQETNDAIVVTATRLPSDAARLPADADLIDVSEARSRGVASLADVLSEAPGLHVVQSGGAGSQASIFSGGASSNHTLVLFDGIRLNDPSSPNSAFDAGQDTLGGLTSIEVVQGPMSAVFGSDAIGGVVNMLPRHGGEGPFNAQLDIGIGSFETISSTASIDGTLGAFRYAVTAEGFATEGYDLVPERMSTHTGNEDGAESTTITGVFDLEVSNAFSLDLLLRSREARADFDAFPYTMSFQEYRADDPDLEIARNDLALARLGATWRISEALSLRASGGQLNYERAERDGGVTTASFDGERHFTDLTLDWRAGDMGVFSNAGVLLGIETEREEVDIATLFTSIVADQNRTGAFITAQGALHALTLTAAARVDEFDGFGTQETWRLGASFALADFVRVYANYGTSFRAPTLNERFDPSYGNAALEAEEALGWEAGADAWFDAFGQERGFEAGLVYRRTAVDNLIAYASAPPYAFINIDEAELESAEARVAVSPLAWLTAQLSYVYTSAENAITGAPLPRRPEESWVATLSAERGPFSARVSWRRVGEQLDRLYGADGLFIAAGNLPSYDLIEASAAWRFSDGAQIYVSGRNLTDETYESPGAFAGAPRNFMVGVRLSAQSARSS